MKIQTPEYAIITGASSGIGREMIVQLLSHSQLKNIRIIATARRKERLEELASQFPSERVIPVSADLSKPDDRNRLWAIAQEKFPRLDLLVNNAGLGYYSRFEDSQPSELANLFAVDVEALLDLTAKAIRWMKPFGQGQIVQVSSILGEVGLPYSASYVAAKHAVNGLVKSLRPELAGSGIQVWAACPGQTESEFRVVAGKGLSENKGRVAEPTGKVAAGIVRAILRGRNRALVYPTWQPWMIAQLAWWCPRLWEKMMTSYGKKFAQDDLPQISGTKPEK